MEPVDGLGKLSRLIRHSVRGDRAGADSRPAAAGAAKPSPPTRSIAALERELRARLKRLRQLDAGTEIATHTLLTAMLEWEFGGHLHNEPKFDALVQQVRRTIRESPALETALQRLTAQLQR